MEVNRSSLLQLEGFDELIDKLDTLPVELGVKRKITAKALRAGAKLIQNEAKRRAPYRRNIGKKRSPASNRYGPLVKNIRVVVTEQSADGAEAEIGLHNDGFYGRFAEYGTVHQPRRPWLGPSFDAKVDQAVEIVAEELDKGIQAAFYGKP